MATKKEIRSSKEEQENSQISVQDIQFTRESNLLDKVRAISIDIETKQVVIGAKAFDLSEEQDLIDIIQAFRTVCIIIDDDDLHKYRRFNIAFENFQKDCDEVKVKNFELIQELKEAIDV